jgi:asparagine N-glycosylation enzyme membrane subunit Stt3
MTEDSILVAFVWLIWTALAVLYAFVPMFSMPGSAMVWGSGAAVFLGLAILTAAREIQLKSTSERH